MYALRHPVFPATTHNDGDNNNDNNNNNNNNNSATFESANAQYRSALAQHQHQSSAAALAALFPSPSYAGLAFACCAAAMPLLQSKDTTVGRAVLSLLRAALPFVLEPRLEQGQGQERGGGQQYMQNGTNSVGAPQGDVVLLDVEAARIQHLLNRLEQVSGELLLYILLACSFVGELEEAPKT